ncbi:MAG: hypothetical protein GYB30_02580 [Gammaproteobacteria bacterium]|nr:hypothetical protein [Gammaproteobacteria bacterium]
MMLTVTTTIVTLLVCRLANASLLLSVATVMVRHHGVAGMRFIHTVSHMASWHWHRFSGQPRKRRQQQTYNDQ